MLPPRPYPWPDLQAPHAPRTPTGLCQRARVLIEAAPSIEVVGSSFVPFFSVECHTFCVKLSDRRHYCRRVIQALSGQSFPKYLHDRRKTFLSRFCIRPWRPPVISVFTGSFAKSNSERKRRNAPRGSPWGLHQCPARLPRSANRESVLPTHS